MAKFNPEYVDAIAEMEDSIKDRADAFSEMEAFLPKKNGWDFCHYDLLRLNKWHRGEFHVNCQYLFSKHGKCQIVESTWSSSSW